MRFSWYLKPCTKISKMKTANPDVVETILDAMPPFKEGRINALEHLLKKKSEKSKDQKKGEVNGENNSDSDSNDDDDDDDDSEDSDGSEDDNDDAESDSSDGSDSGGEGGDESSALGDLLDLGGGSSADGSANFVGFAKESVSEAASSKSDSQGIPRKLMPAVLDSFRKACTRAKAVLCNDGNLQVGIQQQYKGYEGRVMIHLGNKGNTPLASFHAEVEQGNYLKWAPNTQRSVTSGSISPGGSASLKVHFHVMKPFVSPPQLKISYSLAGGISRSYSLRLPIVATRFVVPVAMPGPKFIGIFGQIPAAKQAQSVCDAGGNGLHIPQIKALIKSGLRMAICEATSNQYVVCGAGSFKTGSKDKSGKQLSVGVLVKLECNPNNKKYRITVRAHHLDVSKAVQTILVNQLKNIDFAPGGSQSRAGPYDGGPSGL